MAMHLNIGQKVAYPNQGICLVEEIEQRAVGERLLFGYSLRVLGDNSTIFVPTENAANVGLRPIISSRQCRELIDILSDDFEPIPEDWKTRSRQFSEKLHSGDVFQAADVLKKLTFLSYEKKLSFREQTMLEKAKYLIISEVTNAERGERFGTEAEIRHLVESACIKHRGRNGLTIAVVH
jgi:CarD family transcriptional regulator